ncbi:MAG: type I DNA topoisomerase [Acidobacteriota bacterium]
MPTAMVIVESPAKARTIEKYLGKNYSVKACAGHIKDLPKKTLGVDVEHNFHPTYELISGKERIVRDLRRAAGKAEAIFLAADPDREGEAICQHLAEELNSKKRPIHRVLFNEITQSAILNAFASPGVISRHKVEAQQARRILDRLVGYKVSPLLWRNVRRGLSAGRVQSVALRLIVDRESEIKAFVSEEYWNFLAQLEAHNPPPFQARAVRLDGKKFKISSQQQADQLLKDLHSGEFIVQAVKRKEKTRSPVPPFITSKLQQEASRRLRFSVRKTMAVAQRLYEGIETGSEGRMGLITYMRTDSTRVSESALQEVRSFVETTYGKPYLPPRPQIYRSKKGAQDAHEAIRPTSVQRDPKTLERFLDRDEFRLYGLIWKRFVASQMSPALFDQTEIEIEAPRTLFRAVGTIMRFDGFLKVYQEGRDEGQNGEGRKGEPWGVGKVLPDVRQGEKLKVLQLVPEQKFTQPPPRYSEATLVKALEEKGIGRPSTYAQIISVIQDREYVGKEEGRFVPTETGEVVVELLVKHFQEIFDYDYTARMEQNLDDIESGKAGWVEALRAFYVDFSRELEQAREGMKNLKKEEIPAGVECEKCGSGMVVKWGRFGRFLACGNYPNCKNTKELPKEEQSESETDAAAEGQEACEKCGLPMVLKKGRYGEFFACSGYPECKNTRRMRQVNGRREVLKDRPLEERCPECGSQLVLKHGRYGEFAACGNYPECKYIKRETTGVNCPQCGKGEVVQKRSRRGKVFYGCNTYPQCKFVLWTKPVPTQCPECGRPYLVERKTRKDGVARLCDNPDCSYKTLLEPIATP